MNDPRVGSSFYSNSLKSLAEMPTVAEVQDI